MLAARPRRWQTLGMGEEILPGGVNTVVRIGATVRRPVGPWTPAVHALLDHLAARGFAGAPRAHGIDEQGREVLDYVEGEVLRYPLSRAVLAEESLRGVGRLLREYHDATLGFVPPIGADWYLPPRRPAEVLCHGDFAPHNLVYRDGRAVAVIDFDTAHPGPRVWDFAWTAICFGMLPNSGTGGDGGGSGGGGGDRDSAAVRVRRVEVLADAYRLNRRDREELPEVMVQRLRQLVAHMRAQADAGHPGFSRHVAEGHDTRYLTAVEEIVGLREWMVAVLLDG